MFLQIIHDDNCMMVDLSKIDVIRLEDGVELTSDRFSLNFYTIGIDTALTYVFRPDTPVNIRTEVYDKAVAIKLKRTLRANGIVYIVEEERDWHTTFETLDPI